MSHKSRPVAPPSPSVWIHMTVMLPFMHIDVFLFMKGIFKYRSPWTSCEEERSHEYLYIYAGMHLQSVNTWPAVPHLAWS
jgi:hypothetical protein